MATKRFDATNSWYRPGAARWDGPYGQRLMAGKNASGKDYRALLYFGGLTNLSAVTKIELHVFRLNDGYSTNDKTWIGQVANGRTTSGEVTATAPAGTHTLKNNAWNTIVIPTSSWAQLVAGKYLHFYSAANNQYAEIGAHTYTQYKPYLLVEYTDAITPGVPGWVGFSPTIVEPNQTKVSISWGAANQAIRYELQRHSGTKGWESVGTYNYNVFSASETWKSGYTRGEQIQYRICAVSTTGHKSTWKYSNTGTINRTPSAPTLDAPQDGGATYRRYPIILSTMGIEPDKQTQSLMLQFDTGAMGNEQTGKSDGQKVLYNVSVQRTLGTHSVSIQSKDSLGGTSAVIKHTYEITEPLASEGIEKGEPIRAGHILALMEMVDHLRLYYGVQAINWPNDVFPGERIRASHVERIRKALDEMIDKINGYQSNTVVKPKWTDLNLSRAPIKPVHITEIFDVIQSL